MKSPESKYHLSMAVNQVKVSIGALKDLVYYISRSVEPGDSSFIVEQMTDMENRIHRYTSELDVMYKTLKDLGKN